MKKYPLLASDSDEAEIKVLVEKLAKIQQRLVELTGGQVDAVVLPGGQSYLLQEAQEKLRRSEITQLKLARTQAAILNALPAHIALIDHRGVILSINEGWKQFSGKNTLEHSVTFVGQNYVEICDRATGAGSGEAHQAAEGIRSVLSGKLREFSLEYPCHSNEERRWFRLNVAPLQKEKGGGAVVMHTNITDRKLAEEIMQKSEREQRELSSLLEAERTRLVTAQAVAKIGSWETDLSTFEVTWSAETYRIFETNPDVFHPTHTGFLEFVHPEDRGLVDNAFSRSLRDRNPASIEHRLLMPDGRIKFVEERWQVFNSGPGQKGCAAGTCQDITERKLAERSLRESDERFRSFMENSPAAGWILDENECFRFVSPGYYRMFGVSGNLIGRSLRDVYSPELVEAYLVNNEKALRELRVVEAIEPGLRADGSPGEFLVVKFPIQVPHGKPLLGGIALDISDRKRSDERMRRLVESNVQGVFFWKIDGTITQANDSFLKLTGYTKEDLANGLLRWNDITPPEYADIDRNALSQLSAEGVCGPFEKEYFHKNGSRIPILLGAATFEDNTKEGVCFVLDLTERKKLEQQFLRAQRMESIGTLAGGIAHDLNNVLAPIILSLSLLEIRFPDPQSQELIAGISASAQRGADMVRQVLSFARGFEGRRMEVQIKHLLRDIEKIVEETFLKHIQVQKMIPADLWTVQGDPTQIHQVLLNLCVNARDAMPHGGTLTLSAENKVLDEQYAGLELEAKPGPYIVLQVGDTGTGIPPALLEKIFDPFFTTKEVGKGTGLGLSTSMAIVKSHGGFIRVDSALGKGTRFRVYLPAQTEVRDGKNVEVVAKMPPGNGELILVVDDEVSVRQITQQTLEAFGYRVITAADGIEAITVFANRSKDISIVLTDMMMPGMDGPGMIRVLRKMNSNVAVIAASGLSMQSHIAHTESLSVEHFLPKPYTSETLLTTLRDVLQSKGPISGPL